MRPSYTVVRLRLWSVCGVCALLALLTAGCGAKQDAVTSDTPTTAAPTTTTAASPASASDADMKKSFSQKSFDINSVPPEQREKVRAMMQQNAGTGPSAPGAASK